MSAASITEGGGVSPRIASTMSGARRVRRRTRVMQDGAIPSRSISSVVMHACSAVNRFFPQRFELHKGCADVGLGYLALLVCAAFHVPAATISSWRNTARSWSMTAPSISPGCTRPTGHDPAPCFITV